MIKLFVLFVIGFCTLLQVEVFSQTNYFVDASKGNDKNNGSQNAPFGTIQKAADIAKEGDSVMIRGGVYRETVAPVNSGSPGKPIIYQAYPGETVTISGCEIIDGAWTLYNGNIYQKSIDLPVKSYADHITSNTTILANQIFVKGKAMVLARWPNLANPEDLLNYRDSRWDKAKVTNGTGQDINFSDPEIPKDLTGATVWFGGWFINRTGTVVNSSKGKMTIKLPNKTSTELQAFGDTVADSWTSFRRYYYVCDKLSLLDTKKEWYYDGSKLFLWAPDGKTPADVEFKTRNYAFDLSGKSFIVVKGIDLFGATIQTNKSSVGITIDRINARYISHWATIPGSLSHYKEGGIRIMGKNGIVKNSTIKYSAGCGIVLGAAGNIAENNWISDTDYSGLYDCSILPMAHPVIITHNTMTRTGRCCITDFTTDQISYNDMSFYGMLNCDLGAIYCANNIDCTGSSIDHNYIHDAASWWGNHGIYTDNSSGYALIHHNIFWNVADNSIFRNGGNLPNKVYNNTVVNGMFSLNGNVEGTAGKDDVRNNIFRQNSDTLGSYNIMKGIDPLFVNELLKDFHLKISSPGIDAGTIIPPYTDGFSGRAPDIGAYENGGVDWKAGATVRPPK